MGRIVYVKGNIVVNTPYFYPKECGAGFGLPPDGAIVIEADNTYKGTRCLLIDDNHPQSLFDEYYAQGEFSTGFLVTNYLAASYEECLDEYKRRIEDVRRLVLKAKDWDVVDRNLLYKMAYSNIMTSLDAFICHVVLKRMLDDETLFKDAAYGLAPNNKKEVWDRYIANQDFGRWEQDAIKFIQDTSFLNVEKIDKIIKTAKLSRVIYNREAMKNYFNKRHLLIHRNGMQRDDVEFDVSYELLSNLVNASRILICGILSSIYKTKEQEYLDKLRAVDLEVVSHIGGRDAFEIKCLQQSLKMIREASVKDMNFPVFP